jgi:hypothetical protein
MRLDLTAKVMAVGLCLIVAGAALADGTEEAQTAVKLYRGTSIIASSDPNSTVYRTGFTTLACRTLKEQRWKAEAATKSSGAKVTYKCQIEERSIITFHPAPTCPALPAPEGRTVDCPAGTTGAYTQTRSYTAAPYPTCAVLGQWTPSEPPAGICVPIPPPTEWILCAQEYQTCSFTGTRRVRFGLNTSWVERDVTASNGGALCRVATFGSDPLVGATKRCELRAVVVEPAPSACASRVCDVSWTSNGPSEGFRIFYARVDGEWANPPVQVAGNIFRTDVTMPETGIWYFAVKAYTGSEESPLSNVVVRDVQ